MSNIGLSFDFKEVNSMLRNKSLSELKEGLSTLRFVFDMGASIKPIETEGGTL